MKKAIFVFLITVFACKKSDTAKTYCYSCKTFVNTMYTGVSNVPNQTSSAITSQCGITEEEALQIEKTGTKTVKATSGSVTATTWYTTHCTKK